MRKLGLGGRTVPEVVEAAAQGLAIESDAAVIGYRARGLQQGGMAAEDRFNPAGSSPWRM